MKKVFELFKKEERLPYVALLGLFAIELAFISEMFIEPYLDMEEVMSWTDIAVMGTFGVGITILLIAIIIMLMRAVRYDKVLRRSKKDEREILHEYQVTMSGYHVAIFGMSLYILLFDPIVLPLLVIIVLVVRMRTRMRLDQEL